MQNRLKMKELKELLLNGKETFIYLLLLNV